MVKFNTEITVKLYGHGTVKPKVTYGIDNRVIGTIDLDEDILFFNENLDKGAHVLFLEFYNKTNDTPDMAVEILSVLYEGYKLDRIKWANKYYPTYPQPWASQQKQPLPKFQTSATYLGWNGRIEFEFETPIYAWIHRLENLGWIYP